MYHVIENLLQHQEEQHFRLRMESMILTPTFTKRYQTDRNIEIVCLMMFSQLLMKTYKPLIMNFTNQEEDQQRLRVFKRINIYFLRKKNRN